VEPGLTVVFGGGSIELGRDDVARLDEALRARPETGSSHRLVAALHSVPDDGSARVALRDGELEELAVAIHAVGGGEELSGSLRELRDAVSRYFQGLEHGS
jgi:hypothetical protein